MTSKLLSNLDLKRLAELYNIPLKNVLSKDIFDKMKPVVGNYVVNLDDSTNGGTHWTGLILNDKYAVYYDSFGMPMPQSILRFIKRFNKKLKIIYSIDQIQHVESVYCGWFVLYLFYFYSVLHAKNKNYPYLLNKHNSIFSLSNRKLNDGILRKLFANMKLK